MPAFDEPARTPLTLPAREGPPAPDVAFTSLGPGPSTKFHTLSADPSFSSVTNTPLFSLDQAVSANGFATTLARCF